ncbi:MAG TPA: mercury methylation ferredoxin HgcB [bacterium]|nr:mercury methylation ferredoxin HgcB [bacterium]
MRYLESVVTLNLDTEKCVGCGRCADVCPHRVFTMTDRKATMVDRGACMECGACRKNCPAGAITVEAGVGCAYALIRSRITGKEACCG